MRTTDKLTIVTKTNFLLDEIYDAIQQYPKSEKYLLGADTKQAGLTFYRLIVTAVKKYYKKTTLRDADVELFVLKNFIRMGHSRRYMNTRRYERLSRAIEEVGRMLGGWIQSMEKKKIILGNSCIRIPLSGGNWNNGSNAGLFALNLNNVRSNSNGNIGFRSALLHS